jgi:hypothetical protein
MGLSKSLKPWRTVPPVGGKRARRQTCHPPVNRTFMTSLQTAPNDGNLPDHSTFVNRVGGTHTWSAKASKQMSHAEARCTGRIHGRRDFVIPALRRVSASPRDNIAPGNSSRGRKLLSRGKTVSLTLSGVARTRAVWMAPGSRPFTSGWSWILRTGGTPSSEANGRGEAHGGRHT